MESWDGGSMFLMADSNYRDLHWKRNKNSCSLNEPVTQGTFSSCVCPFVRLSVPGKHIDLAPVLGISRESWEIRLPYQDVQGRLMLAFHAFS